MGSCWVYPGWFNEWIHIFLVHIFPPNSSLSVQLHTLPGHNRPWSRYLQGTKDLEWGVNHAFKVGTVMQAFYHPLYQDCWKFQIEWLQCSPKEPFTVHKVLKKNSIYRTRRLKQCRDTLPQTASGSFPEQIVSCNSIITYPFLIKSGQRVQQPLNIYF